VSFSGGNFKYYGFPGSSAFGWSVACAGDIDNDGNSDVIIGAPLYHGLDQGDDKQGAITVLSFVGETTAYSEWFYKSPKNLGLFGWSVASAGDVNGDGYADIIAGSPGYSREKAGEGGIFLFYGNGSPGLSLVPRQIRSDNTAPIAHRGKSDSQDGFRLSLLGRTPFGRSRVKGELEIKMLSQPFTGKDLYNTGIWRDSGIDGYPFNELLWDSAPSRIYHWRGRVEYQPGNIYGLVHSRWITIPWNGWNEADFRTEPLPPTDATIWILR
jgi:hypothetical protein